MTSCPECGAPSADDSRCERCGTEFPAPSAPEQPILSQASRSVDEVARTLGVKPEKALSGTFVEMTRPPGEPIALEMVPRTEQKRRTWLLFVLMLAVGLYFFNQRQDRREEQRVQSDTAAREATPRIDGAYLDIALEAMLGEARGVPRELGEPDVAAIHVERLLARVNDLNVRLERAEVDALERAAYAESLDALGTFLRDDVRLAIDAESEPDAAAEVLSVLNLDAADAAFARARGR